MIEVLFFSDRDVKRKLFARVDAATRPLLITQLRHDPHARPPQAREPFASLERDLGDRVDQVLVADEGTIEGMWRDPVGDLAERLYPDDRHAAYAAQSGYLLLVSGRPVATVKKTGSSTDDRWLLQEALARVVPGVPMPDPAGRPGRKRRAAAPPPPSGASSPPPPPADPWAVLGIPKGTALADAKRSFRALIAQYHPDKVAHLGPEFRELADRKTREILEAWRQLEEEAR